MSPFGRRSVRMPPFYHFMPQPILLNSVCAASASYHRGVPPCPAGKTSVRRQGLVDKDGRRPAVGVYEQYGTTVGED